MIAISAVTTTGETSALCHSVGLARASFYRRRRPVLPLTPAPSRAPSPRALAADERQAILDTLHSERFVDQSPAEVHATLLEEQTYHLSRPAHVVQRLKGPIPYLYFPPSQRPELSHAGRRASRPRARDRRPRPAAATTPGLQPTLRASGAIRQRPRHATTPGL